MGTPRGIWTTRWERKFKERQLPLQHRFCTIPGGKVKKQRATRLGKAHDQEKDWARACKREILDQDRRAHTLPLLTRPIEEIEDFGPRPKPKRLCQKHHRPHHDELNVRHRHSCRDCHQSYWNRWDWSVRPAA